MLLKTLKRVVDFLQMRFFQIIKSSRTLAMMAGLMCGVIFLALFLQVFSTLGISLEIVTGCLLTVAICLDQGVRRFLGSEQKSVSRKKNIMTVLILTGAVALSPIVLNVVRFGIGSIPLESLTSPILGIVLGSVTAMLVLAVPLLLSLSCVHPFLSHSLESPSEKLSTIRYFVIGIGMGLLLGTFVTTPMMGAYIAAIVACSIILGFAIYRSVRGNKRSLAPNCSFELVPQTETAKEISGLSWPNLWPAFFVGLCGAMMAVICRELQQTMATSLYLLCAQWAALLFGIAWGMKRRWNVVRLEKAERGQFLGSGFLPAVWTMLCLISFPLLVELVLWMNASVSSATFHMVLRSAIAGILVLPLGYVVGYCSLAISKRQILQSSGASKKKSTTTSYCFQIVCRAMSFMVGMLVVRWAGLNLFSLAQLMVAISLLGTLATILFCLKERYFPKTMLKRGMTVAGFSIVVTGALWQPRDNFAFSSRLLFSSEFFVARRRGVEREQIPFLDEARQLVTIEGEFGTYSLWRYRGSQIQLRESGVPQGVVSTDPRTCPQITSEIMPTVFPLVMHQSPRKVMILGMGLSTPLFTAQSFPIENLTCIENDESLIDLNKQTIWKALDRDLLKDDRVKILTVDPSLALCAKSGLYDVIVSNPAHSLLMRAAPCFTTEFYRSAAKSLSRDGIFSQRFFQIDYGAFPLASVVESMQLAFSDVMAIEIGLGEMVLLGTNSEKGLNRPGLIDRLQAAHVRVVLSEIGWDWTIPLSLSVFDNEGLHRFVQKGEGSANSTSSGWLAACLPKEVMRWGPKWREFRETLVPSATRLLASRNIDGNEPTLLRRVGEVAGQKQLMVAYPDQFWAYRKTVKQQISSKPSELIRQVSSNSKLDGFSENDKRRMKYFTALERASKKPSLDLVEKLEKYEFPYDPLISYFLHQEVAELYAKSEVKNRPQELQHRLYAIYYSQARDRSVRNVADAIDLLVNHSEACPSPLKRWDQLNALVQIMKNRWEVRGFIRPKSSKIVLNDLKYSINALDAAKKTMDELHGEIPIPRDHWQKRKIVIERQLIRPLRTYRKNLLDYDIKREARTKQLLEKLEK